MTFQDFGKNILSTFKSNAPAIAIGGGVLALAGGTASAVRRRRKSTTAKKKSTKTTRKTRKKAPTRRKRTTRTTSKRKKVNTNKIHLTKNGQPYVLKANGQARFISKKSAKTSRKRKGGRY